MPDAEGRFQILALSGGGYLGLYTAKLLAELERQAGRPLAHCFDLICGTSIGGILALGLGAGVPAIDMLDAFRRRGPAIFSDRAKPKGMGSLLDLARSALSPKYDGLELRRTVEDLLGDRLLGASRTRLVIPAVNMTLGRIQMFKTPHTPELVIDHRLRMADVAMATSAAPTYFPLAEIEHSRFADGGMAANAPDLCGLQEATCFLGVAADDVHILSLGTTTSTFSLAHATGRHLGAAQWMQGGRLFSTMISAQQQLTDHILKQQIGPRYVRIDTIQSPEQQAALALDVATTDAQETILGLATGAFQQFAGRSDTMAFLAHAAQIPSFVRA